ncbi:MAG: tRNA (adenosine(37)-N6)-threonylcarbamoyltransferase complex ATPase subunit type 1 TsaE [Bacteroidota bacterium]
MEMIIENEDHLVQVAEAFLAFARDVKVAFLYGDLGAGKTAFVKKVVSVLNSEEEVSSPTYSLVNEYAMPKGSLYHIDLYRLNDTHEAQDMGIEEYLYSGEYCFVEWPEIIEHLIDEAVVIKIKVLPDNSRKFEIEMLNP